MAETTHIEQGWVFHELMKRRVQEILLVSSLYDAFILTEDGQLTEQVFNTYLNLNLRYAPRVTYVPSGGEVIKQLKERQFNLIIMMPHIADTDVFELGSEIRNKYPHIPIVLLTYNTPEIERQTLLARRAGIDRTFFWTGDTNIFLAIIKFVEDRLNAEHDARVGMVRVIIVVEDNVKYYSSILPAIYKLIMQRTQELMGQGLNDMDKLMRMRARPKILLASSYEEAIELYDKYRENVLGIISDIRYPRGGVMDATAGFELLDYVRASAPLMPVALLSNEAVWRDKTFEKKAHFIDKNSVTLLDELRGFMQEQFGFGEFVFRKPGGEEIMRAEDLRSLEKCLEVVPDDSILFHARHNHFSTWLMARTEFSLAAVFKSRSADEFASASELREYLVYTIRQFRRKQQQGRITEFSFRHFDAEADFVKLGGGSIGGKGRGITFIGALLNNNDIHDKYKDIKITVPKCLIIGTHEFDRFVDREDLRSFALQSQDEDEIMRRFLTGRLSESVIADLKLFVEQVQMPLAVRSSSLLEDSHYQPFAGVYKTYIIPNCHPDVNERLKQLCRAIKLVYASTYYRSAKSYLAATSNRIEEEKMAVIIQRLAGRRYGKYYYPDFSGVAQSYNFFPVSRMKPEDGVAYTALGLGRAVVDVGSALQFSPAHPQILPQFPTIEDTLQNSQKQFFALVMDEELELGRDEESSLAKLDLADAEEHGTLAALGSAYIPNDNVILDSIYHKGTKLVTFAPILKHGKFPLAEILSDILKIGSYGMGCPIEIEFAVNLPKGEKEPAEFCFLQIRPMTAGLESEDVKIAEVSREKLIGYSAKALGNGAIRGIWEIVYVKPRDFDPAYTREIAREIGEINGEIEGDYLIIGLGRWGTSDPWLGIPVNFSDVSKAKVIVEAGIKDFNVDLSMGTHFFQNIVSLNIAYLTVPYNKGESFIDWAWLDGHSAEKESRFVRRIRLKSPIEVKVEGKRGVAAIYKPD
ncbi:MAG: PEP/pyruvate-binding domain-containing protein [Myxococcota bacterium]